MRGGGQSDQKPLSDATEPGPAAAEGTRFRLKLDQTTTVGSDSERFHVEDHVEDHRPASLRLKQKTPIILGSTGLIQRVRGLRCDAVDWGEEVDQWLGGRRQSSDGIHHISRFSFFMAALRTKNISSETRDRHKSPELVWKQLNLKSESFQTLM